MELDKTEYFIDDRCAGCMKTIDEKSLAKNIYSDDVKANSSGKTLKINVAMEMIAGQKFCNNMIFPKTICESCYKNLEICLNFKAQLVSCFNGYKRSNLETTVLDDLCDRNTIDVTEITILNAEDQINVDKSSDSETSEDEGIIRSMRDEQENDNSNAPSEGQITDTTTSSPRDNRILVNDIESDIDVCSGEDDEILELDVHRERSETIQLDTSSESDIDVCDYEPTGKRMKNYGTLFHPIH